LDNFWIIFVKLMHKFWTISVIFKKLPKVNSHQIGEKPANLVALTTTSCACVHSISYISILARKIMKKRNSKLWRLPEERSCQTSENLHQKTDCLSVLPEKYQKCCGRSQRPDCATWQQRHPFFIARSSELRTGTAFSYRFFFLH
jgi:hypothetical protein